MSAQQVTQVTTAQAAPAPAAGVVSPIVATFYVAPDPRNVLGAALQLAWSTPAGTQARRDLAFAASAVILQYKQIMAQIREAYHEAARQFKLGDKYSSAYGAPVRLGRRKKKEE